jgi:transmembrane sensor
MDELAKKTREIRDFIREPSWNPAYDREILKRLETERSQPIPARLSLWTWGVAAAALLALVFGFAVLMRERSAVPNPVQDAGRTQADPAAEQFALSAPVFLEDGSHATPLGQESRIALVSDSPSMVELNLQRGGARFEVVPNKNRRFRVDAGPVSVEALGTVFTVTHAHSERVRVAVVVGRVRVEYRGGSSVLAQGDDGVFPPAAEAQSAELLDELNVPPPAPASSNAARELSLEGSDWRALAESRKYADAYRELASGAPVRDQPAELLLAADVARKSGHPAEAARYLSQIVERYPSDPRASVAAFTLGRVYSGLGRPADAARAFGRAQALGGALASDALAHEADAWEKAGDSTRARERAKRYVSQHPSGSEAARLRERWALP